MSGEAIGITISAISLFITIIIVAVRLERRFNRLGNRIERLRDGINQVIRQSNGTVGLFGTLIGSLSTREVIRKQDIATIVKDFANIGRVGEINVNPLSRQQVDKLNGYVRKARSGGTFTRAQVEEYDELVAILEEERPDDPKVWPLVALAAFLLGLYVGRNR